MKCQECREKLMRSSTPAAPAAEIQAHFAMCAECRQFQQRLLKMEAGVARIAVPASHGPARFLEILRQLPAEEPVAARTVPAPPTVPPARHRRNPAWIAAAVAASLLLAAGGIYYLTHRGGPEAPEIAKENYQPLPQAQPLLAQVLQCDLKLAEGAGPADLTASLAELVRLLQNAIESKPDDRSLQTLARMHRDTLFQALVPLAQKVPQTERDETLAPIIGSLVEFHEKVTVLAPGDPAQNEIAQKIAQDIHDAHGQLRNLLSKKASEVKPAARPSPSKTVEIDWPHDMALLQAMVVAGRKLALESEPLKRAQYAHDLAEQVGGAMQKAAAAGAGTRVADLGQYLQAVLTQGVAGNVTKATQAENAPSRADLDRFAKAVSKSAQALEADLRRAKLPKPEDMDAALKAIHQGRIRVENSLQRKQ